MKRKRLGILAGMGPRSTAPFLELVYDECQKQYGAQYDMDYPEIVIYSWPTPFYIDRQIDDHALRDSIKAGLVELDRNNVSVIALPCNVAHKYYAELAACTQAKLLNILEIATSHISRNAKRITVLATRPTMDLNIYQDAIAKHGKEFFFEAEWQTQVNKIIALIKNKEDHAKLHTEYAALEKEIQIAGIDTILFACTDLAVIRDEYRKLQVIDSSKALAEELIKEYLK